MRFRIGSVAVEIKFSFLLLLTVMLIRDINNLVAPVFAGVMLHELGHMLCMSGMGVGIKEITLSLTGIHISKNTVFLLPPYQEVLVHLAGPLANLVTVGCLLLFPQNMQRDYFIVVSIMVAAFNMLPAANLDGANILRCVLSVFFRPKEARTLFRLISLMVVCGLLWLLWQWRDTVNISAIVLWVYLLYITLKS